MNMFIIEYFRSDKCCETIEQRRIVWEYWLRQGDVILNRVVSGGYVKKKSDM